MDWAGKKRLVGVNALYKNKRKRKTTPCRGMDQQLSSASPLTNHTQRSFLHSWLFDAVGIMFLSRFEVESRRFSFVAVPVRLPFAVPRRAFPLPRRPLHVTNPAHVFCVTVRVRWHYSIISNEAQSFVLCRKKLILISQAITSKKHFVVTNCTNWARFFYAKFPVYRKNEARVLSYVFLRNGPVLRSFFYLLFFRFP